MRIIIYIENLLGMSGGAEVYALKAAEILSKRNEVNLLTIINSSCVDDAKRVFDKYNVKELPITKITFSHKKNRYFEILNRILLWRKIRSQVKGYDVFFNTSHNRLIGFRNIRNVHLIHFPMKTYESFLPKLLGKYFNGLYKKSYNLFISNSQFTQFHLKKIWDCDSKILNPPIEMIPVVEKDLKLKKKKICMVGRLISDKKILEVLRFYDGELKNLEAFKNYEFVVVGNKDINELDYYETLKMFEQDSRIRILADLPYAQLIDTYRTSEIFIHAKGFNEDENVNPILMEHFGMTTVEAMANGCIPVVINKAGQKEIVRNDIDGFLWNDFTEMRICLEKIVTDENKKEKLRENALKRFKDFSFSEFENKLFEIFSTLGD